MPAPVGELRVTLLRRAELASAVYLPECENRNFHWIFQASDEMLVDNQNKKG
jgi:hypothetical protein